MRWAAWVRDLPGLVLAGMDANACPSSSHEHRWNSLVAGWAEAGLTACDCDDWTRLLAAPRRRPVQRTIDYICCRLTADASSASFGAVPSARVDPELWVRSDHRPLLVELPAKQAMLLSFVRRPPSLRGWSPASPQAAHEWEARLEAALLAAASASQKQLDAATVQQVLATVAATIDPWEAMRGRPPWLPPGLGSVRLAEACQQLRAALHPASAAAAEDLARLRRTVWRCRLRVQRARRRARFRAAAAAPAASWREPPRAIWDS